MEISVWHILIILGSGLLAGFINTLAGGGSFLTLAALDLAGLPAAMANGTNRVAVAVQNVAAVMGFRSKGVGDWRFSIQLAIPSLFGAVLGAYVVIDLPEVLFRRVLAAAMLIMLAILIIRPERWIKKREIAFTGKRCALAYVVFFALGFYGGAIQAGVGFFLIAALVLFAGLDLVKTNSHKVFIVGSYTILALLMFAWRGQVNWVLGLVLAVGNSTGAWIASRLAVAKGDPLVRWVLGIMLAVLSIRYLGIIPGF
jgi:hypothetical protein